MSLQEIMHSSSPASQFIGLLPRCELIGNSHVLLFIAIDALSRGIVSSSAIDIAETAVAFCLLALSLRLLNCITNMLLH